MMGMAPESYSMLIVNLPLGLTVPIIISISESVVNSSVMSLWKMLLARMVSFQHQILATRRRQDCGNACVEDGIYKILQRAWKPKVGMREELPIPAHEVDGVEIFREQGAYNHHS